MAGWRRVRLWGVAIAASALLTGTPVAGAEGDGVRLDVALDLKTDGSLSVNTTITVPEGQSAADRLPLDVPVEANRIQHFHLDGVTATGGAEAAVEGRTLRISAPAGTSTVSYTVHGSVADGPDVQQFTWVLAAGWSAPIQTLTGTYVSPSAAPDSPICAYGTLGVRRLCSLTQIDPQGQVTFRNDNLPTGNVAVFSILMPAGTATATAQFDAVTASAAEPARDRSGVVAIAAGMLAALGLAGFGWLRRRADAVAHTAGATASLLVPRNGEVVFASPDGVLPGQIGALTTGRARPADIGATILDLAVRNYLWIAELPGETAEHQISRRAPLDAAVTGYERAVLDAILPGGRENVIASELSYRPVDLVAARDGIVASVAAGGWIRRRTARLEWVGFGLLGTGALAAVGLAAAGISPAGAFAAALLGAGLAVAGRLQPSRTRSGSRLAAAVVGMRQYLAELNPAEVNPAGQPVLFERALPYAHALGQLGSWLAGWGAAQPARVEWYQPAGDRPLPAGLLALAATLDGVAAHSEAAQQ